MDCMMHCTLHLCAYLPVVRNWIVVKLKMLFVCHNAVTVIRLFKVQEGNMWQLKLPFCNPWLQSSYFCANIVLGGVCHSTNAGPLIHGYDCHISDVRTAETSASGCKFAEFLGSAD